jgi:capsular exopolysaccharide synthesis family protein
MSRVFEALTRAGEEKEQQVESPVEKVLTGATEATGNEKTLASVQHFKANGTAGKTNGTDPRTHGRYAEGANGGKPWRERIEEWLFGWDLRRYSSYPIVALEKGSPASEQYKILRQQVKQLRAESGIRSFALTSPVKRDGKTTVAVNLAAALSLDYEESVLLIDGDLRAPGIHPYFNAHQSPGLTDYLGSEAKMPLKRLVQETFLPGLLILSSGKSSHLASELLAKERMTEVMEEARTEFPGHHIIIDCPPILSTPDPFVIARHVDGVLVVIRAGKTPRDYLTKALQSLNSSKVMGVVLNGARLGIASKYYYYSTNGAQ